MLSFFYLQNSAQQGEEPWPQMRQGWSEVLVNLKQMRAANLRAHCPFSEPDDFADEVLFSWFLVWIKKSYVQFQLMTWSKSTFDLIVYNCSIGSWLCVFP